MSLIVKMYGSDGIISRIINVSTSVEFYTSGVISNPFLIIKRAPLVGLDGVLIDTDIRENIYGDVEVVSSDGTVIERLEFAKLKEKRT